jgi:hypothetical protein
MGIVVGPALYDEEEAEFVLAGYCFAEEERATKSRRQKYGDVPSQRSIRRYGYQTYDCVEPDPGPRLGDLDLLVASGLNARLDVRALASLMAVREEVSDALEEQARRDHARGTPIRFWELEPGDIRIMDRPGSPMKEGVIGPIQDSPVWGLYRAWYLLITSPDIGTAVAHKVLHHKLPTVAPLLDGRTEPVLARRAKETGASSAWAVILGDLRSQEESFERLETFVGRLVASRREGRPLSRLRIHDVLLWSDVIPGERQQAQKLGGTVLSR